MQDRNGLMSSNDAGVLGHTMLLTGLSPALGGDSGGIFLIRKDFAARGRALSGGFAPFPSLEPRFRGICSGGFLESRALWRPCPVFRPRAVPALSTAGERGSA